jgi:hypothetical protein
MPRSLRVRLHRQAADGIERAHADDPTPRLNELAHHYYEAAAGGSAAEAARYCRLSAEHAYEATAFEESVAQYRRALNALELTEPQDERERIELLLGLGRALRGTSNSVEEVRAAFVEAAERSKRAGLPQLQAEAAMRNAGRGPMRVSTLRDAGTVHGGEIELLDQARAAIGAGDSADRALVEAWLAYALYNSERREQRKELARTAVEMARRVRDPKVLAECLLLQTWSVRGPAGLDARVQQLDEIIELTRQNGLLGAQLDAHCERAWAHWERGQLAEAEADMHTVQRLAEESRQPHEKRAAAMWRVMKLDADARFAEGDALLKEIDAAYPMATLGRVDQGRAIRTFMIASLTGRSAEMIPVQEAYAARFPLPVAWHCGLASTYATVGRLTDAARELGRLAVGEFACIPDDHNWINSHGVLSAACRLLGDADTSLVLYRKLLPYANRMMAVGIHGFCSGIAGRCLGEFATVFADYDAAEHHFLAAIEDNDRLGAHIWSAASRLSYAEMLVKRSGRGDHARAFEQLTTAISYCRARNLEEFVKRGEALLEGSSSKKPMRGSA